MKIQFVTDEQVERARIELARVSKMTDAELAAEGRSRMDEARRATAPQELLEPVDDQDDLKGRKLSEVILERAMADSDAQLRAPKPIDRSAQRRDLFD